MSVSNTGALLKLVNCNMSPSSRDFQSSILGHVISESLLGISAGDRGSDANASALVTLVSGDSGHRPDAAVAVPACIVHRRPAVRKQNRSSHPSCGSIAR